MKIKNSRHSLCLAAALATLSLAATPASQNALTSPGTDGYMARAQAFYRTSDWQACLDQLDLVDQAALSPTMREELAWQQAMASFKLQRPNARQLFEDFVVDYPASVHRQDARMGIADCLFTSNYAEALAAYKEVELDGLSPELHDDYTYRTAYCYLHLGEYDQALSRFESLQTSDSYGNAARFYCGYIAYVRGDYSKAKNLFAQVNTTTPPGNKADYYLSQIYFAEGDYPKALSTAQRVLSQTSAPADFVAEANRIAGESLYLTGRAEQAISYLRRYVAAVESPILSTLYILGLSEYGSGDYQAAVKTLAPVTGEDSSMGQNANVYTGQALMRLGDKDAAIISFDRAIKMRHDDAARENAYYNYAVAKYMGGNVPFGSSVSTLEDYLRQYPNSSHAEDVRAYIIDGWMTDNNYEAALESIERVEQPSARVLTAKQRVLYTLGARSLAGGRIDEAIKKLEEAEALRKYDTSIAAETDLALGEAYLRDSRLDDAATRLLAYICEVPEDAKNLPIAYYDLGYTRLAQKEYAKAATNFAHIIGNPLSVSQPLLADAYTRLGDANYYQKNWEAATDAYSRALELQASSGDYPLFQMAIIDGYTGRFEDEVARLDELQRRFPSSALMPEALFEKAKAQTRLGNLDNAEQSLTDLTNDYSQTSQSRQALLQLAITLDRKGKHEQADKTYRAIISKYPSSDEALQALEALKAHAAANGTMNELMDFVDSIENAPQVDVAEADRLSFESAEELYLEKDDASRLRAYINQYPNGSGTLKALVYLMEAADAAGNDERSYEYACRIVEGYPDNVSVEDALLLKADIEYDRGQGELALQSWQKLAACASNADNKTLARMGIMRVARDTGNAEQMIEAADAVLSSTSAGADDRTEATFSRGLALQMQGKNDEARKMWASQSELVEDIYGAKSAVYLAQSLLDDKQLDEAYKVATDFVGRASSHSYWLGRGFIVLSDITRAKGNAVEADLFLESLKANYPGTEPDIFDMIDQRLKK